MEQQTPTIYDDARVVRIANKFGEIASELRDCRPGDAIGTVILALRLVSSIMQSLSHDCRHSIARSALDAKINDRLADGIGNTRAIIKNVNKGVCIWAGQKYGATNSVAIQTAVRDAVQASAID